MSDDFSIARPKEAHAAQVAEHERQFLDILEHCPAGLNVVDEEGRLLFHNARVRELFGYDRRELHLFDTRKFWSNQDQREQIIGKLREGGSVLNQEVLWKTKSGETVPVLVSYPQVAYHGGHIDFAGCKRVAWIYDITALRQREEQLAEHERQFREILDYCPAGLNVVDEDGRLLFHNARVRELLGYTEDEMNCAILNGSGMTSNSEPR